MEKLRTFILVFVLGCALTATARADGYERQEREEVVVAHAPVACCSNWRGFYFGLNAGALWTESDISAFGTNGGGFVPDFFSQIIAAGQGDAADNSYIVGLQFGYNLQWGHFVLGLETDFNYMKTSTTRSVSVAATGFNNTILHSDTRLALYAASAGRLPRIPVAADLCHGRPCDDEAQLPAHVPAGERTVGVL
jgi:outer membrane immunogenic protein